MSLQTDYATYLRIDDLLDLQQPLSDGAADEMLFIVVHQVYELWFKLILHELDAAATALDQGRPHLALAPLRRAVAVEQLLIEQLRVLESMSPDGFMRFRDPLAPASGFQSTQFREIEALSGGGDARHLTDAGRNQQQRAQLGQRLDARSLYHALGTSLRLAGLDHPGGDDQTARERPPGRAGVAVPRPRRRGPQRVAPSVRAARRSRRDHRPVATSPCSDGRARDW